MKWEGNFLQGIDAVFKRGYKVDNQSFSLLDVIPVKAAFRSQPKQETSVCHSIPENSNTSYSYQGNLETARFFSNILLIPQKFCDPCLPTKNETTTPIWEWLNCMLCRHTCSNDTIKSPR